MSIRKIISNLNKEISNVLEGKQPQRSVLSESKKLLNIMDSKERLIKLSRLESDLKLVLKLYESVVPTAQGSSYTGGQNAAPAPTAPPMKLPASNMNDPDKTAQAQQPGMITISKDNQQKIIPAAQLANYQQQGWAIVGDDQMQEGKHPFQNKLVGEATPRSPRSGYPNAPKQAWGAVLRKYGFERTGNKSYTSKKYRLTVNFKPTLNYLCAVIGKSYDEYFAPETLDKALAKLTSKTKSLVGEAAKPKGPTWNQVLKKHGFKLVSKEKYEPMPGSEGEEKVFHSKTMGKVSVHAATEPSGASEGPATTTHVWIEHGELNTGASNPESLDKSLTQIAQDLAGRKQNMASLLSKPFPTESAWKMACQLGSMISYIDRGNKDDFDGMDYEDWANDFYMELKDRSRTAKGQIQPLTYKDALEDWIDTLYPDEVPDWATMLGEDASGGACSAGAIAAGPAGGLFGGKPKKRVTEISQSTKDSYVKRASTQQSLANFAKRQTTDPKEKAEFERVEKKRARGLNLALDSKKKVVESEGEAYDTLADAYEQGETKVLYLKPGRDADRDELTAQELAHDYVMLGTLNTNDPEVIFGMLQGEIWSPSGEAEEFIRKLGLDHTSMQVGDVVVSEGKVYLLTHDGFKEIGV